MWLYLRSFTTTVESKKDQSLFVSNERKLHTEDTCGTNIVVHCREVSAVWGCQFSDTVCGTKISVPSLEVSVV